jgi:hypothetical protein
MWRWNSSFWDVFVVEHCCATREIFLLVLTRWNIWNQPNTEWKARQIIIQRDVIYDVTSFSWYPVLCTLVFHWNNVIQNSEIIKVVISLFQTVKLLVLYHWYVSINHRKACNKYWYFICFIKVIERLMPCCFRSFLKTLTHEVHKYIRSIYKTTHFHWFIKMKPFCL